MKIIIVTQQDPFYLPYFFDAFFGRLYEEIAGIEIAGVIIQKPLGQKSKRALVNRMIDFYGPLNFTIISLRYVLLMIEKRLNEMHVLDRAHSIEHHCVRRGVRIFKYRNVNNPKFIAYVRQKHIDLIVSVAASQIFRAEILRAPRMGCINIHNAPLPDYRGMMPSFWQMLAGEKHVTATIHEMVEEIDKGKIIFQQQTNIDKGMTLHALIKRTRKVDADALIKVLRMFRDNQVRPCPLPRRKGSYFSFPSRRDVAEFRRRGYRIV
jgi:methionyl-tRNA formyltransferase